MNLIPAAFIPLLRHPRTPYAANFLIACGLVVGALIITELWRLAACPLCILQRMACLLLALAALPGLLFNRVRILRILSALLMLACTLTGAGIAAYQTWIQRVAQDVQCSGEAAWWELLVDRAGEQFPLLFQASGLCSDPAWTLFGLSLAEYSLLSFCILTLIALYALLKR